MDLITKNTTNKIVCNISNEAIYDYFDLVIDSDVYSETLAVTPIGDIELRSTEFLYIEGVDLTFPATGDYPYYIVNKEAVDSTTGIVVHRGILRLKQAADVVYSHLNNETTIIYEP